MIAVNWVILCYLPITKPQEKCIATMVGVILFVFLPLLGGFLWIFDLLTLSDSAVDQESHHRLWTSHILVPWAAWESPSFAGFLLGFIDGKRGFLCINKTLVEVGIMKFTLFVNLVL